MSRAEKTTAALLVWLLALTVDLGYFAVDRAFLAPDSSSYLVPAAHMVEGKGFTNERLEPETRRTPGYPVLIALCREIGWGNDAVVFMQHLARSLLAVAVFFLADRRFRTPFIALAAGVVFALDFSSVVAANRVMTETFFAVATFALFWVVSEVPRRGPYRWLWAVTSGLFGGFTVLIRPISLLLFVPLGIFVLLEFRRRALLPLTLMCSTFLLFPAAWALHNREVAGVATVSTISADNLLRYRAAGALAEESPGDFLPNLYRYQDRLSLEANEEGRRLYGPDFDGLPHAQRAEVYSRVGIRTLLDHPSGALRLAARGIATTFLGGGAAPLSAITGLPLGWARGILLLYTGPCLAFALLGLVYLFRSHRSQAWAILLFVGYFTGISAGSEAYSRFRVPVMPIYALAVAAGLYFAWNRFRVSRDLPVAPDARGC